MQTAGHSRPKTERELELEEPDISRPSPESIKTRLRDAPNDRKTYLNIIPITITTMCPIEK
jgi:hypothetical protein